MVWKFFKLGKENPSFSKDLKYLGGWIHLSSTPKTFKELLLKINHERPLRIKFSSFSSLPQKEINNKLWTFHYLEELHFKILSAKKLLFPPTSLYSLEHHPSLCFVVEENNGKQKEDEIYPLSFDEWTLVIFDNDSIPQMKNEFPYYFSSFLTEEEKSQLEILESHPPLQKKKRLSSH